jgi:hypothetical protein
MVGLLPLSDSHDMIITYVCYLTKQAHFFPCKPTITAEGLAEMHIQCICPLHGTLEKFILDCSPQFAAQMTKELYRLLGIKHAMLTSFHPQSNGQTERTNQEIGKYLCMFCGKDPAGRSYSLLQSLPATSTCTQPPTQAPLSSYTATSQVGLLPLVDMPLYHQLSNVLRSSTKHKTKQRLLCIWQRKPWCSLAKQIGLDQPSSLATKSSLTPRTSKSVHAGRSLLTSVLAPLTLLPWKNLDLAQCTTWHCHPATSPFTRFSLLTNSCSGKATRSTAYTQTLHHRLSLKTRHSPQVQD